MSASNHHPYQLEIQHHAAESSTTPPLLFIHGMSVGAWVWQHFLPWFAKRGYDSWALSLRGHGQSEGREDINRFRLHDYMSDVASIVALIKIETGQLPILIGHSMGGLVAQALMSKQALPAVVLLNSIPPQGLTPLAVSAACHPYSARVMLALQSGRELRRPELLTKLLFHNPPNGQTLQHYQSLLHPESMAVTLDLQMGASSAMLKRGDCQVAVLGGWDDQIVPRSAVYLTAMSFGVWPVWLYNCGHSSMLERNWSDHAYNLLNTINPLSVSVVNRMKN